MAKICEALQPNPDNALIILDMFGFDGWAGQYAISQCARGAFPFLWCSFFL